MKYLEFGWRQRACAVCVVLMAAAVSASAQLTSLFSFDKTDGNKPVAQPLSSDKVISVQLSMERCGRVCYNRYFSLAVFGLADL